MRRITDLVRRRAGAAVAWRRWLGIFALACIVAGAGATVWLSSTGRIPDLVAALRNSAVERAAAMGLVVDDVLLEGRVNTPRRAVLRAVGVRRGQPILGLDPHSIARRVLAIGWVESVVVRRLLPATLHVRIVERAPMALWQNKGRLALIDRGGVVLTRRGLAKFSALLTVVGGDAPRHTPALLTMIAVDPKLAGRVRAAVRVGGRRWNLRFDNGVDVSLPGRDAALAWARLGRLERKHGLLGLDIKAIDLRLPDRLIVRRKPGPAPVARQQGKKT